MNIKQIERLWAMDKEICGKWTIGKIVWYGATPSLGAFSMSQPFQHKNSPPSYIEARRKGNRYRRRGIKRTRPVPISRPPAITNDDFIGKSFYIILRPMQWAGVFPVSIKNSGEFYGMPTWKIILTTTWMSVSVISCVAIYTLNRAFDIDWPIRLWAPLKPQEIYDSTSGKRAPPKFFTWVTLALQIIIPISTLTFGHLTLHHLSSYYTFLNKWTEYSKLFQNYFPSTFYSLDLSDFKKYRNCYLTAYCPTICFTFLLIPYLSGTKVLQIAEGAFSGVSTVITVVFVESLIAIRVVFSMRDCLNLHVLEIAYRELRKGIEGQYTTLQGKVNRLHVRNWLKMVVFIRDQRTRLENHIGLQNNYLLVEIFCVTLLVLTASVVVIMNEIDEYFGWVTTYVGISTALIFFLFFQAQLAEGISEQEELLAESIVGMTDCDNCDTRLEMKSLCDMIFHDPIKITLGYVFVLNKRLMLAFCGQLAASLVILLQFVNH